MNSQTATENLDSANPATAAEPEASSNPEAATGAEASPPAPLRSVHTANFPAILEQLGISVLVTTYQAGKLVMLRPDGGGSTRTSAASTSRWAWPCDGDRLAVGTGAGDLGVPQRPGRRPPAGARRPARRLLPAASRPLHRRHPDPRDGLGRASDLWFVNTRFSCLCTLDRIHSFVPRWRPPFITALAPEDRCHLNGLCLVEGRPAYVTALGETDTQGGWRANKKDGGVLDRGGDRPGAAARPVDAALAALARRPPLAAGIGHRRHRLRRPLDAALRAGSPSCPASRAASISPATWPSSACRRCARRAIFSGIPIAERPVEERRCGVWVVDITTGATVAFVKFEDAVQEIFAVQVLPGIRYPDADQRQQRP